MCKEMSACSVPASLLLSELARATGLYCIILTSASCAQTLALRDDSTEAIPKAFPRKRGARNIRNGLRAHVFLVVKLTRQ
jgi:hypothetical protein